LRKFQQLVSVLLFLLRLLCLTALLPSEVQQGA
jgi:hypothetical protein